MFLAKASSTPMLVIITFTLLLANISIGQMHGEYQILDCSEMPLEKDEAQMILARPTEKKEGECAFFIKLQVNRSIRINRSIRMKFKCVDVNSMHSNSDCLQHINVSVLNKSTWTTIQGTFSFNRDEKIFCITSKDVMITLNTKVQPYLKHWKVRYEVTDNDCEKDVRMKEPEAKAQRRKDEVYISKEAMYYQGQVEDQIRASSFLTRSTKTLNFKTISSEGHVKYEESAANKTKIWLLFPTPSHRSMPYHTTQSTTPLNMLPIEADFQSESSVGQRESMYGSLNRGKLFVSSYSMGTSKKEKISNLFLSLQEYIAAQSAPGRKLNTQLMKSTFSKRSGKSTTTTKRPRTAPLHPTKINYSASISEKTNAGKDISAFSVGLGEATAPKQRIINAKEHRKEADWSKVRDQRSEMSSEIHKTKSPKLYPSPQLFHGLESKKSASHFEHTAPLVSISNLSLQSTSSSSLKTTRASGDLQKRYHEKDQQSMKFDRESRKLNIKGYSSQAKESKDFKSKVISGTLVEINSEHRYSVLPGDINDGNNTNYFPYTNHPQSNLSTSSLLNAIGDSSTPDGQSLTKDRVKNQPTRTVVSPTASSLSDIFHLIREVTEHRTTHSSEESLSKYTIAFKPNNSTPISTVRGLSVAAKKSKLVQNHNQLYPTQDDSLSSLGASDRSTRVAPFSFNNIYGSSSALHGPFSRVSFASLSSKQTPNFSLFVKGIPEDHLVASKQSMTDENAERTFLSLSVNYPYSDSIKYSSKNKEHLETPSTKDVFITSSDSLKTTEVSYLHQTTTPLYYHFISSQPNKKVKTTLISSLTVIKSQVVSSFIDESKRNALFTTKMRPASEMTEHKIYDVSKSAEDININNIRSSATSLRNFQLMHVSTPLQKVKDISLTHRKEGSSYISFTSNFRHLKYSKTSRIMTQAQTSSTFPRPTKSSGLTLKSSIKLKDFEDLCSYHFINNINGLETDDEMRFEVLDILSLKIKRVIAVSWPYDGYLGRAGFIHRGLVLQTMDGRLWYNHIQNKESYIYMVYLTAMQDLHRRIQITYSHNVSEDGGTLKEHVDVWGEQVGMYFRTCSKKEWKN